MNELKYRVIRSGRKTLSLQIKDGELLVRVPYRTRDGEITAFIERHRDWIDKHYGAAVERQARAVKLTVEELKELADRALAVIPERVAHFARLLNLSYGRITIRNQRTRWGSCSGKGNLNFNCLLMLAPAEVLDSVVVHELCHLKEMNHSSRFYALVEGIYPDYHRCHAWLKENGQALLARLP